MIHAIDAFLKYVLHTIAIVYSPRRNLVMCTELTPEFEYFMKTEKIYLVGLKFGGPVSRIPVPCCSEPDFPYNQALTLKKLAWL